MHPFQGDPMAVQNPFFGKREPDSFQRNAATNPSVNGLNSLNAGAASSVGNAGGGLTGNKPVAASGSDSSGSKLTVGPNMRAGDIAVNAGLATANKRW
eukprot:gene43806-54436_t